jgi:hypothetical protein
MNRSRELAAPFPCLSSRNWPDRPSADGRRQGAAGNRADNVSERLPTPLFSAPSKGKASVPNFLPLREKL